MKAHWAATHAPAAEGVDAVFTVWTAEKCCCVLGQELTDEGRKLHGGSVSAAKGRDPNAWTEFTVFQPVEAIAP